MTYTFPPDESALLRLPDLIGRHGLIGVSKSAIWAWVAEGRFPAPIRLGKRAIAWRRSDVLDFIATRETCR